jgi:dTDP-4-amino-4,6-dideoxygalactose transaminase
MSLMSGKSFPVGEGGILVTRDRTLFERCVAYGHYERTGAVSLYNPADKQVTDAGLARFSGSPIGGTKHRMNQMCSALGRVQLKYYPQRIAEIQRAMNRFWDYLEGAPGLRAHRPTEAGSTMGGWYAARGLYRQEELGGLPCPRFCEALRAEGIGTAPGANHPLHLTPVVHEADIFRQGQPTAIAFGQRDVRQGPGTLPVTERIRELAFGIPWFKHDVPQAIARHAAAYLKVARHAAALLAATPKA